MEAAPQVGGKAPVDSSSELTSETKNPVEKRKHL